MCIANPRPAKWILSVGHTFITPTKQRPGGSFHGLCCGEFYSSCASDPATSACCPSHEARTTRIWWLPQEPCPLVFPWPPSDRSVGSSDLQSYRLREGVSNNARGECRICRSDCTYIREFRVEFLHSLSCYSHPFSNDACYCRR